MLIPKYAFIDLDNTLYSYEQAHAPAHEALVSFLAQQLRLEIDNVNRDFESSRHIVKNRLGNTASSHSRLIYITEFLNQTGLIYRPAFALSAEQVYWKTYLANMSLFDGVKDFLTLLRMASCKTILVTDLTSSIQYRKIGWLGLDNYFDLIVTSEDAGGDKISGMPEQLLVRLLGESNPAGWSIGDQEWDHLFKESTIFMKKLEKIDIFKRDFTLEQNGEFKSFSGLIDLLQRIKQESS